MSPPMAMGETSPDPESAARRIAELEARVAALEAALKRRSRELRVLQGHLCRRDLITLSRLATGLPALARGAYEPELWRETTDFTPAQVDETLTDLWHSLVPFAGEGQHAAEG